MIGFALTSALLAAIVLFMVLRPLLRQRAAARLSRRDANVAIYKDQLRELEADLAAGTVSQADYGKARLELEARLLDDVSAQEPSTVPSHGRRAAIAVALAVPLVAVAVYVLTGNLAGINPHGGAPDAAAVDAMVERLAARMRENPDDAEGWKLLGRSYTAMGKFPQAVEAFAKAAERSPRDAQLLADFADVLALTRGRNLEGEPAKLVERALEIDPKNLKALALWGTIAYERKQYALAAETWGRMLPLVQPGSEDARVISENVEEARKLAGIGASVAKSEKKDPARPGLRGTVTLSPELQKQVKPEDAVFVFARAADGPPMPLAVVRAKAGDLPLAFSLDDSMAMSAGMQISAHPRVIVVARVSKSGSAQATKGDLQGASKPVANNAAGVSVVIDSVVP
ncbi:MAG TPA: c-type cytochrome biogenesis protein CcmI [Burkholderiales bacterium]|nr:c-type cytochrome biogenesis protein CcmI [Burkholderiales bacterium]